MIFLEKTSKHHETKDGFNQGRRKILIGIIGLLLMEFLILFVLVLVVAIIPIYNASMASNRDCNKKECEYQYFQVDHKTLKSHTANVLVNKQLKNRNAFLSFQDDDGNYVLISNFGVDEFFCTGSCQCEVDRKVSSLTSATRGVVFLVAGISSFVAFEKAKDYFQEECTVKMSDSCPSHSIKSKVNDCQKVDREESNSESSESPDKRKYWCKGSCKLAPSLDFNLVIELEKNGIDCKRNKKNEIQVGSNEMADVKFKAEYLDGFCSMTFMLAMQKHYKYNPSRFSDKEKVCVADKESLVCKQVFPNNSVEGMSWKDF